MSRPDLKDLKVPTIHLNGTSSASLLEANKEAYLAVRDALDKLRLAAPNGRDFYVQSDTAFTQAALEHRARAEKLLEVARELEHIANGIYAQDER